MPGPAPKRHVRRRNARPEWVQLPAAGRPGRAPKWPLKGRAPAGWAELWRLPQAVMWEKSNVAMQVATYLLARNKVHELLGEGNPHAALMTEVRQCEDRLGLSPMALKRLQWEIVDQAPKEVSPAGGQVIDANDRFKRL